MSGSPVTTPPTPGQIRAALAHHAARKLGWSGRSAAHLLGGLSNDDVARCAALDPIEARGLVFVKACAALGGSVIRTGA